MITIWFFRGLGERRSLQKSCICTTTKNLQREVKKKVSITIIFAYFTEEQVKLKIIQKEPDLVNQLR